MKVQNEVEIEHGNCTFYVYSAIHEWSYFSGERCEIDQQLNGSKIDPTTGYLQVTFHIEQPNRYFIYCVLRQDVRGCAMELVLAKIENVFYQQLLIQQQEQQVATLQLMGALNSSLQIKPLLQAIVEYALKAIPVIDRGFLMLYDERLGKLYTVASKGVTERIFDYVPSVGEGMAGYTFRTGKARIYEYKETQKIMWNVTPRNMEALIDAVQMSNFEHNTSMAVPITYETWKFGVMIVHQYTNKRPFQLSDLRLLQSFASQAAVALRNAELYERMEKLNADYQKQDEIYKKYLQLSLQDVSANKIVNTTEQLLQHKITYIDLMDRQSFLSTPEMFKLSSIKEAQLLKINDIFYVYPIQNEQEVFGYLLVKMEHEPTKLQQLILGNASVSLILKALQLSARNQLSSKERYELFLSLISGDVALKDVRYEELQLDVHRPTFVLVFKLSHFTYKAGHQLMEYLYKHFTMHRFIFIQRDRITWVLQGDEEFRERLLQQLATLLENWQKFYQQQIVIGAGTIQQNLLHLQNSMEEAEQALQHSSAGKLISIIPYEDLGINRLFGKQTVAEIQHFVDQILAPLLYGKDETLLPTIKTYVQKNRSVSLTAQALHIHQNTLYHRLSKIERLLEKELTNPQHYLEISLALHLHEQSN